MIPTKNYKLIGFIKQTATQNWTKIPDGTILSIPTVTENIIEFAQSVLKTKFSFFMFYLKEVE